MEDPSKVEISEDDVLELMDQFTRVPPLVLKMVIRGNSNVVKNFHSQIEEYKNTLTPEEILKIRKVLDMPVDELQDILNRAYQKTKQQQLIILADPKAQPFIKKNLQELGKIIF